MQDQANQAFKILKTSKMGWEMSKPKSGFLHVSSDLCWNIYQGNQNQTQIFFFFSLSNYPLMSFYWMITHQCECEIRNQEFLRFLLPSWGNPFPFLSSIMFLAYQFNINSRGENSGTFRILGQQRTCSDPPPDHIAYVNAFLLTYYWKEGDSSRLNGQRKIPWTHQYFRWFRLFCLCWLREQFWKRHSPLKSK